MLAVTFRVQWLRANFQCECWCRYSSLPLQPLCYLDYMIKRGAAFHIIQTVVTSACTGTRDLGSPSNPRASGSSVNVDTHIHIFARFRLHSYMSVHTHSKYKCCFGRSLLCVTEYTKQCTLIIILQSRARLLLYYYQLYWSFYLRLLLLWFYNYFQRSLISDEDSNLSIPLSFQIRIPSLGHPPTR